MTQDTRQPGVISQGRRPRRDYPVVAEVEYKVLVDGKPVRAGHGWTVTLSSAAVLFDADGPLGTGNYVELLVSWPAVLNGNVGLRLWIWGFITHTEANRAAVEILRYEYRTRRLVGNQQGAKAAAKTLSARAGAA